MNFWGVRDIKSRATDQSSPDSWAKQINKYDEYLKYWTGEVWEELAENIVLESGDVPLRFPVKFNLIKIMAITQAMCIWGQFDEEILTFRADHKDPKSITSPGSRPQEESAKEWGKELAALINKIYSDNHRETLLIEQGLINQVYGGCVFKIRLDHEKDYLLNIENISPYYFKPTWHPTDYHTLLKAEIIFKMTADQVEEEFGKRYVNGPDVLYHETWTRETHSIYLDDEPLVKENPTGGEPISYAEAENPYGLIPIVYIPRMRMEEYYGLSICEDLMGLQDELNDRIADIGDQILNECHAAMTLINFSGNVDALKPSPNGIINLGMGSPTRGDPKLERLQPGDIPTGVFEHIKVILDFAKMSAFTPPIAFGQDEGSQRSGITLVLRMWPLLQQARWARAWWDEGFRAIAKIMLKMLEVHKPDWVREEYQQFRIVSQWSPVQPKDREALINELAILATHNIQSLKTMISRLEDVQDVDEEMEEIKKGLRALLSVKGENDGQSPNPSTQPVRQ